MTTPNPALLAVIDAARNLNDPRSVLDLIEALAEDAEVAAEECAHNWQDNSAGVPWALIARNIGRACAKVRTSPGFALWKD